MLSMTIVMMCHHHRIEGIKYHSCPQFTHYVIMSREMVRGHHMSKVSVVYPAMYLESNLLIQI